MRGISCTILVLSFAAACSGPAGKNGEAPSNNVGADGGVIDDNSRLDGDCPTEFPELDPPLGFDGLGAEPTTASGVITSVTPDMLTFDVEGSAVTFVAPGFELDDLFDIDQSAQLSQGVIEDQGYRSGVQVVRAAGLELEYGVNAGEQLLQPPTVELINNGVTGTSDSPTPFDEVSCSSVPDCDQPTFYRGELELEVHFDGATFNLRAGEEAREGDRRVRVAAADVMSLWNADQSCSGPSSDRTRLEVLAIGPVR
jgi:hypothetical protein